ncbi:ankyrin repeat-containing domain protein [Xylariales sp. PMI_506]|nr:ankyrin repeat-containing domain protein [Xylariales sp. PMI_506]
MVPQNDLLAWFPWSYWIKIHNLLGHRGFSQAARPMYILADQGLARLLRTLCESESSIEVAGDSHHYPFLAACRRRHLEAMMVLLQLEADDPDYDATQRELKIAHHVSYSIHWKITPVGHAVQRNLPNVCRRLVEKGSDLEARSGMCGQTPLGLAAQQGRDPIVSLLLQLGADINARCEKYGLTPLAWAAWNQQTTTVKLLLDKGG